MSEPIRVEIVSDVVCPWCYIGKRRFERAVAELAADPDLDIEVTVAYRAFQLDPTAAPGHAEPVFDAYVRKFGGPDRARQLIEHVTAAAAAEGITFQMDRALRAHTLLAHRLLWWADQPGSGVDQSALKERLLQAYFVEGLDIGDPEVLARCAAEVGTATRGPATRDTATRDTATRDTVAEFLAGDAGRAEVAAQIAEAADRGITSVPTFVIDGTWVVPGAQETDTFVNVLQRIHERRAALAARGSGNACDGDACPT